jgi:hypothetical protein
VRTVSGQVYSSRLLPYCSDTIIFESGRQSAH